jgi:hypothetical protein
MQKRSIFIKGTPNGALSFSPSSNLKMEYKDLYMTSVFEWYYGNNKWENIHIIVKHFLL